MIPSERHPIASFFLDGYFIETLLNLINKIYQTNEYLNISIRIIFLSIFLFYHIYYYKKTRFRTVGELLTGTFVNSNGNKYYLNPFYINRFILWIPMFISFVGMKTVNTFSINDSVFISATSFLIIFFMLYFSYILLNKGYVIGLILLLILYSVAIFNLIYNKGFIIRTYDEFDIIEFVFLIISMMIITTYWIIRIKRINNHNNNGNVA